MADVEDITPHVIFEGVEEATEQLRNLGTVGAEAFAKIVESAASGNFTGLATLVGGEVAGSFTQAAQAVGEFVDAAASAAETLSNLASATGMSLPEIEGLKDAFASVGISANGFERAIGRLAITIGNEWSQIQQSVRESADQQTGAMLHVQEASLGVRKAYNGMNDALNEATKSAAHNANDIEGAAISLARAMDDLNDFAQKSAQNSLSVESASLSLRRAQMNLTKDSGGQVSKEDEQALKIAQDKNAVAEAGLRLQEAQSKKAREGLDIEEAELKVKKARQGLEDAGGKAADDAVKNAIRIQEAQLGINKAQLAVNESSEKQHEQDLKNIPAIAKEVENVVSGYKKWDEVMNHAEISAQNLTKAVILAASGGGEPPKAMEVFKEIAGLFEHMGDSADAMNKKLEIVQHTMGAGFRSGQASAAQMLAIMERGPEALAKFTEEAEKFQKSSLGMTDKKSNPVGPSDVETLKEYNAAWGSLGAILEQVKGHLAALAASAITPWLEDMRKSIEADDGALHKIGDAIAEFIKGLAGIGESKSIWHDMGEGVNTVFTGLIAIGKAAVETVKYLMSFEKSIPILKGLGVVAAGIALTFAPWTVAILLVAAAVGTVVKNWDGIKKAFSSGILGEVTHDFAVLAEGIGTVLKLLVALVQLITGDFKGAWKTVKDAVGGKSTPEQKTADQDQAKEKDTAKSEDDEKVKAAAEAEKASAEAGKEAARESKTAADALGTAAHDLTANSGNAADKLTSAAQDLTKAAMDLTQAASKPGGGKAEGGMIRGAGSGTSDQAGLFALSDGEYVVKSAAVSHYGPGLFESLNNLAVGGFAVGGMVGGVASPRGDSGKGQPAASILNLTIDGQQFNGLKAPDHVAAKLKTYAVTRQSSSAGKMPSWMR